MKIKQVPLPPYPANCRTFALKQPSCYTTTDLGKDLLLVGVNSELDLCLYLTLINTRTGERIRLDVEA